VRDIYEVLREKEDAIKRVRREVEALRSVTPLLDDETGARSNIPAGPAVRMEATTEKKPPVTGPPVGRRNGGSSLHDLEGGKFP
jgi:hypothetical protein